jgi:hypothetical protein
MYAGRLGLSPAWDYIPGMQFAPNAPNECADRTGEQLALFPSKEVDSVKPKRRPPAAGMGRPKGSTNKATRSFRETIERLLHDNRDNVAVWLRQIAEGIPPVIDPATGKVLVTGRPGDPVAAMTRLGYLAEFAAPRLSRVEQVGEGGGPLTIVVRKEA